MKRGKKAQFYLIAAIILAAVIIGLTAVSNYSKRQTSVKLNDLKEELQIESSNVLDYGVYNELSQVEMNTLLKNFTNDYIVSEGKNKNMYFIFGDKESITVVAYQETAEDVTVDLIEDDFDLEITIKEILTRDFSSASNQINIIRNESSYEFELNTGENFYFIVSQKIDGEEHVITN